MKKRIRIFENKYFNLLICFVICILCVSIIFASKTRAASFTSQQDGTWNDGATWGNTSPGDEGSDFPGADDNATIENSVTLSANQDIHDVTVSSGGTLTLGSFTFTVSGDITNQGTLVPNTSSINLTGTNQKILGANTFNNLSKATSDADTLTLDPSATTTVTGILTLTGAPSELLTVQKKPNAPSFVRQWGAQNGIGAVNNPRGVAIDSSGNIYIAASGFNRINKYSSSGVLVNQFGSDGTAEGGLNYPNSIATDSSGNVYVLDSFNYRVQKFNSAGIFQTMWGFGVQDGTEEFQTCTSGCQAGVLGAGEGQFNQAFGIAIDATGNIYVADTGNNRVEKLDASGAFISFLGTGGSAEGEFLYPTRLGIDSTGNVYVTDTNNNRVQKFDSAGNFIIMWGFGVQDGTDEFQTCTVGCQAGIPGSGNGQLDSPSGVAADSSGNVYVTDTNNNRVQKFSSSGSYVSQFGADLLSGPVDIVLDSSDNIYVADANNNVIQKFDTSGNFITNLGGSNSQGGQFNGPSDITYDSSDNIYVVDSNNNRIQKFDSSRNFLWAIGWGVTDGAGEFQKCTAAANCQTGSSGDGDGQFNIPYKIALDPDGNIYVADNNNHRIQKFDSDGVFLSKFGSNGSAELQFNYPGGIAFDSAGNTYVTDAGNYRIQKFDSSGNFLMMFGFGVQDGTEEFQTCTSGCQAGIAGGGDGQFNNPGGVTVDSSGNIYVTDIYNSRIEKFNSSGAFVSKISGLYAPNDVTLDSDGNIFITDGGFNNVSKFDPEGNLLVMWGWGVQDGSSEFQTCSVDCNTSGVAGNGDGQFNGPHGIAFNSNGNLSVTNYGSFNINDFSFPSASFAVLDSQGTVNASFLSVSNIHNVGSTITCTNCTDGGGNTGWDFVNTVFTSVQDGDWNDGATWGNASPGVGGTDFPTTGSIVTVANDVTLTENASAANLTINSGASLATGANDLTLSGNLTIDGTLNLGSGNLNIAGNWTNSAAFNSNSSTVNLTGSNQSILGINTFHNLIKAVTTTDSLSFDTAATTTITGTLNLSGILNGLLTVQPNSDSSIVTFVRQWGMQNGLGGGQFNLSRGVAISSLTGDIYVTDYTNSRIQKFNSSGTFIMKFGQGHISNADDLALDSSDNVYVIDETGQRVQKFDSSGNFLTGWGTGGSAEGQFGIPSSIEIDSSGNVFVADRDNDRIQKFDSSGNFLMMFGFGVQDGTEEFQTCTSGCQSGTSGSGEGQFSSPLGITLDSSGNIYVSDWGNSRVQKFNSSGTFISQFGTNGTEPGQFSFPIGIALDSAGNIYVADHDLGVQKFDSSGNFIASIGSLGTGDGQFSGSWGIALDSSGNIYVADDTLNRVQKFDPAGTFITRWGSSDTNAQGGQFSGPFGIAYDSSGNIYVVDGENQRIQKFDSSRNFLWMIGWGVADGSSEFQKCTVASNCDVGIAGGGEGQFSRPFGIALDSTGSVFYVTDFNSNRVQKFDSSGNYLAQWGTGGDGEGQFAGPIDIVVDGENNVLVMDYYNNRIQKFDSSGVFITTWGWGVQDGNQIFQTCTSGCRAGNGGGGDGQLSQPYGIDLDSVGNIYVADTENARVQKFSSSGDYISQFGGYGSGEGQFAAPTGVAFDSDGNIYVADNNNHRVQKFDSSYNFISTWGWGVQDGSSEFQTCTSDCTGGISGSSDGQFLYPLYLAFDPSGNLSVTNSGSFNINDFAFPSTFTIDPQGSVSVSYLSVENSNNVGNLITCTNCTDSGGNTGWIFTTGSENPTPETPPEEHRTPSGRRSSGGGGSGGVPYAPGISYNPLANIPFAPGITLPVTTPPVSPPSFTKDLETGITDPQVKLLQQYLNTHGYILTTTGPGSPGNETTRFGALTRAALIKFQKDHGITPSVGYFGPKTRAFIAKGN